MSGSVGRRHVLAAVAAACATGAGVRAQARGGADLGALDAGASSGVGAALALRFAQVGHDVVLVARREARCSGSPPNSRRRTGCARGPASAATSSACPGR